MDLYSFFDATYLINLERRPDRLTAANDKLAAIQWPFKPLSIIKAIDGSKVAAPPWYRSGNGAWGCRQTHLRILEDAMMQGLNTLLILEDDFYFANPSQFVADTAKFLHAAPDDWDILMLGGQHMGQHGGEVCPGVVKCFNTQRTHAYAIRGKAIPELYKAWSNHPEHIDWAFKQFMPTHKCYAADPFLIGQDEGKSDINGADNPRKLWRAPKNNPPVFVFVNTPRETIEILRTKGFHFGRNRDAQGQDVGLLPIFTDTNERTKPTKLRSWISMIDWEAASQQKDVTAIWHQNADVPFIKSIAGDRLIVLDNPTIAEAMKAHSQYGSAAE